MHWTAISRRGLLAGAAGVALGRPARAGTAGFVSAARDRDGSDRVVAVDGDGRLTFSVALPSRGHAATPTPDGGGLVVVARRPGTWLARIDLADGRWRAAARAPAGRHFYGHAAYGSDRRLYVAENDIASGDGRIAIYDAELRRLGEFASGGIGPHQLAVAAGGLVVANGGLLTHPDSGRDVLNLADMRPNVSWLDPADGRLLRRLELPARWHQLSLRHIAVLPDGRVAVAAQHQGLASERPPLLAIADAVGLRMVEVPDSLSRRWRNYAGSVAVDVSGEFCAVSHPRGGLVSFYRLDRPAWLGLAAVPDACGLAPDAAPGRFRISDGFGGLSRYDAAAGRLEHVAGLPLAFDNHLAAV